MSKDEYYTHEVKDKRRPESTGNVNYYGQNKNDNTDVKPVFY
jgi:hypothetical protein